VAFTRTPHDRLPRTHRNLRAVLARHPSRAIEYDEQLPHSRPVSPEPAARLEPRDVRAYGTARLQPGNLCDGTRLAAEGVVFHVDG